MKQPPEMKQPRPAFSPARVAIARPGSEPTRIALWHGLALAAMAALALALSAASARAEDDDERSFEQGIIHSIMTGLGASDGTNKGIDYRERSPLVIPPKVALPAPETNAAPAPNWPKDPDIAERKARIRASKDRRMPTDADDRPLSRAELEKGRVASTRPEAPTNVPGADGKRMSPEELGYKGGMFDNILGKGKWLGGKSEETATFTGEPTRNKLTAPPTGYQTPSSSYAYGVNTKDGPSPVEYNPDRPLPPGKF